MRMVQTGGDSTLAVLVWTQRGGRGAERRWGIKGEAQTWVAGWTSEVGEEHVGRVGLVLPQRWGVR